MYFTPLQNTVWLEYFFNHRNVFLKNVTYFMSKF